MAGHSKWAKIKRQKAGEDAKRGAAFTKLGNSIALAAKTGGDPDLNPALALAIQKAKDANMPNANIERSIKRGTGELGGSVIEEITYEGYGPSGIAVIVECATDNRNRTAAEVRSIFTKNGGNMAETGAVSYQFTQKGVITVMKSGDDESDELKIIDAGADDIYDEDDVWSVHTESKSLHNIKSKLEESDLKVNSASLSYVPNQTQELEGEAANKAIKLMDALDELDDVVETYTNFDIKE